MCLHCEASDAAHLAAKVDAASPAVVIIIALVVHKATVLDDLPVQPKYVYGQVVAAQTLGFSASIHRIDR